LDMHIMCSITLYAVVDAEPCFHPSHEFSYWNKSDHNLLIP